MSRARDAGLAIGLLLAVVLIGSLLDADAVPILLVSGAGATAGAETLAYQRPETIRALFDHPAVLAFTLVLALAGIAAGAILAPDWSLSLAAGALVSYLLLLGIASATGWAPTNEQ